MNSLGLGYQNTVWKTLWKIMNRLDQWSQWACLLGWGVPSLLSGCPYSQHPIVQMTIIMIIKIIMVIPILIMVTISAQHWLLCVGLNAMIITIIIMIIMTFRHIPTIANEFGSTQICEKWEAILTMSRYFLENHSDFVKPVSVLIVANHFYHCAFFIYLQSINRRIILHALVVFDWLSYTVCRQI